MFDPAHCPEHTKQAIQQYLAHKIPPGGFLHAILTNNLTAAFQRADHINSRAMGHIAAYLMWEVPSIAWGSEEKVNAWLASRENENE